MALFDTKDQQDLLWGATEDVAAYLGTTARSIRRYRAGKPLPGHFFKLLQLRYGDLSGIFGPDWDGFTLDRDGKLCIPGFKYGFSAWELRAMFFERQELHYLRLEVKKIGALYEKECAHRWADSKLHHVVHDAVRIGR